MRVVTEGELYGMALLRLITGCWTTGSPRLEPSEVKVLLYIARQTAGWHKAQDRIAYSQMVKGKLVLSFNPAACRL